MREQLRVEQGRVKDLESNLSRETLVASRKLQDLQEEFDELRAKGMKKI